MNCTQVRQQLPALVYGDVSAEQKSDLQNHLEACRTCRAEHLALQRVRRLLDTGAPPNVQVEVPQLYRMSALLAARTARRWQRTAVVAAGIAAVVVICAFGLRFKVQLQSHQLVLRWGELPTADISALPPSSGLPEPAAFPGASVQARGVDEELQLVSQLIHALADDLQEQDRRHRLGASELLTRVKAIEQQTNRRYVALEKEIETLYRLSQKGE